ncbi:hypothetical protein Y032_0204g1883 [Ancylostoma ceylanicum]|uniref:Uncharacterized protein n=1 Tax=Ancylostoma ceylanicum TaxID=53326 RepID=A0A016SMJ5_9BILA|nr:hypothetical protein Y032_0204g1883 [Ancylostoma ceylanicum]
MATDKSIPKAAKFVLGGSAGVSQTSLAVVAIATSAGCSGTAFGRHMDKVNEETPDERGMIIKGAWQSIGILSIIAITHIATTF